MVNIIPVKILDKSYSIRQLKNNDNAGSNVITMNANAYQPSFKGIEKTLIPNGGVDCGTKMVKSLLMPENALKRIGQSDIKAKNLIKRRIGSSSEGESRFVKVTNADNVSLIWSMISKVKQRSNLQTDSETYYLFLSNIIDKYVNSNNKELTESLFASSMDIDVICRMFVSLLKKIDDGDKKELFNNLIKDGCIMEDIIHNTYYYLKANNKGFFIKECDDTSLNRLKTSVFEINKARRCTIEEMERIL